MSEKVLGFKEKDVSDLVWTECGTGKQTILVYISPTASEVAKAKGKKLQTYREVELVPVISLEWLEKYVKKQRKLIAGYKTKNPFLEGHYDGRIEALEVLLTEAKELVK